ncbi:MAG: hypothetical protein AAF532_08860 [Planctomycetota bacterium]
MNGSTRRPADLAWLAVCLGGSLGFVGLSTVPGLLEWVLCLGYIAGVLAAFVVVPVGFVAILVVTVKRRWHVVWPRRETLRTCAVAVAVAAVLGFARVPMRVGFELSRRAFEFQSLDPPRRIGGRARPFTAGRIGLYSVDSWATDDGGGVFFRTGSHGDGIGPDIVSYGFCVDPNPQSSPYGAAGYTLRDLGNGWYQFSASDDWF